MKFGGTSVANIPRIREVAKLVIRKYISRGRRVVIVVSAMSGITDSLNEYLREIGQNKKTLEHDVVLSSGESVSMALLSIIFNDLGYKAQSFLGWQLPIITDGEPGNAHIISISTGNIYNCFDKGIIPIIAGFQGITELARVSTLGRGGSDTTAVAIAAALKANECHIYTDVDGVYTADPRIVFQAKKIEALSSDEMLEMSFYGAKVLQARSVEIAMKHNVPIRVLSSFKEGKGTYIGSYEEIYCNNNLENFQNDQEVKKMEKLQITGITSKISIVKFEICSHDIFQAGELIAEISTSSVQLDWISSYTVESRNYCSFVVSSADARNIAQKCAELKEKKQIIDYKTDYEIAQIAVVGIGVSSRTSVIDSIFQTLQKQRIPVLQVNSSPLSFRILVPKDLVSPALVQLHSSLNLGGEAVI